MALIILSLLVNVAIIAGVIACCWRFRKDCCCARGKEASISSSDATEAAAVANDMLRAYDANPIPAGLGTLKQVRS